MSQRNERYSLEYVKDNMTLENVNILLVSPRTQESWNCRTFPQIEISVRPESFKSRKCKHPIDAGYKALDDLFNSIRPGVVQLERGYIGDGNCQVRVQELCRGGSQIFKGGVNLIPLQVPGASFT